MSSTSRAIGASVVTTARRPSAARRGALTMLPMVAAYVPFALVVGSAGADQGAALAGWAGSWLIFGGSAHLAALRTLDAAGPAAAIFTGLLVNARLVAYSAALGRRWAGQPRWFRLVAAALMIDPTWAAAERHADECDDPADQRRYFLAAALTLGVGWSAAIAVGAVMGTRLDGLDLAIVAPLCLLGLVGPKLTSAAARPAIAAAAVVAFVGSELPYGTGLLTAVVVASAVGVLTDRRAGS